MPEGPPIPVPDDVLMERALELGLLDEAGEVDLEAIKEVQLPLSDLTELTGYSRSALAKACRSGKLEAEMCLNPRTNRQGWFSSVAFIERYRAELRWGGPDVPEWPEEIPEPWPGFNRHGPWEPYDREAYKQTVWAEPIEQFIHYAALEGLANEGVVVNPSIQRMADWASWMKREGHTLPFEEIKVRTMMIMGWGDDEVSWETFTRLYGIGSEEE